MRNSFGPGFRIGCALLLLLLLPAGLALATSLDRVKQRGVLRHLGIPYANFVTADQEGLDQDLIRRFAAYLGVCYEWVPTTWADGFSDLTGNKFELQGDGVVITGPSEVRGDLLANGLTLLPWREKLATFSLPTFPTGVWLLARADSSLKPIEPTGDLEMDIARVRASLQGRSVLAMKGTCLDPGLYDLPAVGAKVHCWDSSGSLNDLAPALLDGAADATLLDIPDALVALERWPGEIKVIGPVSKRQLMGVAFSRDAEDLVAEFNRFFRQCWSDGTYRAMVENHYPSVFLYLGDFFAEGGPR